MKSGEISRRFVVGALGAGALSISSAVAREVYGKGPDGKRPRPADGSMPTDPGEPGTLETKLLYPLVAGSPLDRWTVLRLLPVEHGAASIVVSDGSGRTFQLDLCLRDDAPDAPVGPARTEHFDVFVANHGDGAKVTDEEQGLAAMALAEVVRGNEHGVDRSHFKTLRQRLDAARVHLNL